jgi:predicted enzyme related to lactoylglutathione lyase
MGNPVIHFEVVGKDGAKLQSFYGDMFDWKINADNEMNYGIVDNGGEGINGGVGESPNAPHLTWYVQVDDIDEALKKAESLGGKTVMPKETIPNMVTFALFSDPEGNLVGLVEGM